MLLGYSVENTIMTGNARNSGNASNVWNVSDASIARKASNASKGVCQIIKMEIQDGFYHEGWGGSRGSRVSHTYSEKWFFKKPFTIIPWLWKRVLHLVWALYYVYIVDEMTLNMAK